MRSPKRFLGLKGQGSGPEITFLLDDLFTEIRRGEGSREWRHIYFLFHIFEIINKPRSGENLGLGVGGPECLFYCLYFY